MMIQFNAYKVGVDLRSPWSEKNRWTICENENNGKGREKDRGRPYYLGLHYSFWKHAPMTGRAGCGKEGTMVI